MRIGPIELEFWHLLLIAAFALVGLWVLRGFMTRVSGTWERIDEGVRTGQPETITLVQFGPFIRGRRMMNGGFQELTGFLQGRMLRIDRRDHGREMLIGQGFPQEIAAEIDGTVTAKMRLTLSADGKVIFGEFTPQKIEFTHQPPKITRRLYLDPSYRRYRLISREILDEIPPDKPAANGASKPSSSLRKTV